MATDDPLRRMSKRGAEAHADLTARGSKVYAAFLKMERAVFADGALAKRPRSWSPSASRS